MNFLKIQDHEEMRTATHASGPVLVERIKFPWREDLSIREKWNVTNRDSKELVMKELCFIVDEEQLELLHPVMEEEPKCQITFGNANLETLSLVFRFKLTDMKVSGTMRSYSATKPLKSFPYELFLKNVEFEIMAGLIIRGDSFFIENYFYNFLNYNISFSYKIKDESKEVFPLDKIQNQDIRKSVEKYIVDKLTKDIIIAVEDRLAEDCWDTSVCSMLNNEYIFRNKLRLHKKRMSVAFEKFVAKFLDNLNQQLEQKNLSEVKLPNLYGKLLNTGNERDHFKATDGSLQGVTSLKNMGEVVVYQDGEDVTLLVFLYFSALEMVYKNLVINKKDSEESRVLEIPENSNSSFLRIKVQKAANSDIKLSLLDYKIDDIGYIEIDWDKPVSEPYKKRIEPEVALWLNYALEFEAIPLMENQIRSCLQDVLNNEDLVKMIAHAEQTEEIYDSDPMVEDDEEEEDESGNEVE